MTLDARRLLELPPRVVNHSFTERDTILYALGVGAGQDPDRYDELAFVYEVGLQALPSLACVLAYPGFWQKEPEYGIDWKRVLHAEHSVRISKPLPVRGTVRGELTVDSIFDKGAGKGALMYSTRRIFDASNDELLATVRQASFLRGDGGCGGSAGPAPKPHIPPTRSPDEEIDMITRPEQALIYRLSGDYNPLHADPEIAKEAGLSRPILHGLCSYGVAIRALVRALCPNRPDRLRQIDCRFTAPVYPGDVLTVSIWRDSPTRASFRARVVERESIVLNNGFVELAEA